MNDLIQAKVVFVGASGVGKSSVVAKMTIGKHTMLPNELTIAAAYAQLETSKYKLLIWDTAGSERFQTFLPMYMRGARVVMAVYDVTDMHSLDHVARERARIIREEIVPPTIPWILVGNKVDVPESAHQVSHRRAQALADSWVQGARSEWEQVAGTMAPVGNGAHLRVSAKTAALVDRLPALIESALDKQSDVAAVDVVVPALVVLPMDGKENSSKEKPCC